MKRKEQIIEASQIYAKHLQKPFVDGALWADKHTQNLWHDAQGDYLPEIDREVIVLCDIVLCDDCHGVYKVCFGHRPVNQSIYKKSVGYKKHGEKNGKNILTEHCVTTYLAHLEIGINRYL